MAYLEEIVKPCQLCGSPAKVHLYNQHNMHVGWYCRRCGNRKLKQLQYQESKAGDAGLIAVELMMFTSVNGVNPGRLEVSRARPGPPSSSEVTQRAIRNGLRAAISSAGPLWL